MIKKDVFGGCMKAQLQASSKDRLYRFMLADGMLKGAVVNCTRMVMEMRANHVLDVVETLVLGQAYVAASLLTSGLKGKDRLSIHIDCSGPVKGLDVESNVYGEVRGYLKNSHFSRKLSGDEVSLSTLFGAGFLTVTKYLEDSKSPYSGKVMLSYGTLAQDLANYFVQSEQIPTAFHLSVHFDENGNVDGAGGLFLQAMPGADSHMVAVAEERVAEMPSLGVEIAQQKTPDAIVSSAFGALMPIFFGNHRVEFFCRCSDKAMAAYLARLPREDKLDILENAPFPLEIRCHNCNTLYTFNRSDIEYMVT